LKPLPFPESEKLVFVTSAFAKQGLAQNACNVLSGFFLIGALPPSPSLEWPATIKNSSRLTGLEQPLHVAGLTVSGDFFTILGTKPLLGRGFTVEEEKPGTRVIVLSHETLAVRVPWG